MKDEFKFVIRFPITIIGLSVVAILLFLMFAGLIVYKALEQNELRLTAQKLVMEFNRAHDSHHQDSTLVIMAQPIDSSLVAKALLENQQNVLAVLRKIQENLMDKPIAEPFNSKWARGAGVALLGLGAVLSLLSLWPEAKEMTAVISISSILVGASLIAIDNVENLLSLDLKWQNIYHGGFHENAADTTSSAARLEIKKIQNVEFFLSGKDQLETKNNSLPEVIRFIQSSSNELLGLWLIGSTDKRELKGKSKTYFGSNVDLATARALAVKKKIEDQTEIEGEHILITVAGSSLYDYQQDTNSYKIDRIVEVFGLFQR